MAELLLNTPVGRVYAQAEGDASSPLVLAVHGFSPRNGWQTWRPLMQPLAAAGYYVVSVDMPGWGQSTALEFDALDLAAGTAALGSILSALRRDWAAAIMGKSWGGALALCLALDSPQSVEKLILTAPAFADFGRLRQLTQPVLLAWATDDPTIPVGMAAHYEAALADVKLVIYETGGHSAAPNNADDFAPRAIAFLNKSRVEIES